MRDEIDARIWNEYGHQFSEDLHRMLKVLWVSLCKLNKIQFEAPWRKRRAKDC
jgi:hypothetical protein